jgi:hypothetical protein
MMSETLRVKDCTLRVLGVVKGLVSESAAIEEAFDSFQPEMVTVSLSKEELEGLENMPEDFEPDLTRYDEMYAAGLSRFGQVAAPPPCYVAALELAARKGVPLIPVDLDEESYTDLYCSAVPGTTLFRHSTRTWLLRHRRFNARTAEEFVRAWDRAVNNLQGFRTIERKRTESMAKGIAFACERASRVLAVIELERADDVIGMLRADGEEPAIRSD